MSEEEKDKCGICGVDIAIDEVRCVSCEKAYLLGKIDGASVGAKELFEFHDRFIAVLKKQIAYFQEINTYNEQIILLKDEQIAILKPVGFFRRYFRGK